MIANLIIDGNYLLSKNTFYLHKSNILYGALPKSLEASLSNYRRIYTFANIYFVSDSKEKSWRKKLHPSYKDNRKKTEEIDWEFVSNVYDDFKSNLKHKGVKLFEYSKIEGDDWISYLVSESNKNGISNIIISNDYDIKQLLKYELGSNSYINIMSNEKSNSQKIFLPKNYQVFLNSISTTNDDIFNLNDNDDFVKTIKGLLTRYELHEVDPVESLLVKIISGDKSDNIESVWSQTKNGKTRGIAEKGAKNIFGGYTSAFGDANLSDPDLLENIADLICENKKLSKTMISSIKDKLSHNLEVINLDLNVIDQEVVNKMRYIYGNIK